MLVQLGLEASSSEEFRTPKDLFMEAGSLQNYLEQRNKFGIPTGFDRLDRMTCGMRPGQLWILAGFTSGGKSALARNIALNASRSGHPGVLRKLKAERGIKFAIGDYLQLMTAVGRFDNRTNEVSHLSRGLNNIAVDLKIPIVALSQFKRIGDVPRRPKLSDLRESGSIEQDANVVILLHCDNPDTEVCVCDGGDYGKAA